MRYTRQFTTAILIVATELGMRARSAHPGATIITNNGDYSIVGVDEAVDQIATVTGGQFSIGAHQVRTSLVNEPQFVAVTDSVGISVTDEQVDQAIEQIATQTGAQAPVTKYGACAVMRSLFLNRQLSQVAQMNPGTMSAMNEVFEQARTAANAQVSPRLSQPALGGGQAPTMSLFGDTVSGAKDDPTATLLGGSVQ